MVYLIDASVYVFRAWYSMPPDMQDADGNPTQALYGFARFLCDLIEQRKPRYLAVAFDESLGGGYRERLYPAYKANREPAPQELKRQFSLCREFCRHLGVAEYALAEYEADDLIGTLAARMRGHGLRITVVSRDKDLSQLVGPGDSFWDYSDSMEYKYEQIAGRFGVRPERMADFLALAGDSVDNIPGVPGVGQKTAAAIMANFESLDALYADLAATASLPIRGASKLPEKLALHREAAYLAQSLTRIHCAAPFEAQREHLTRRQPALDALTEFCTRHGFGSALPRQAQRIGTYLAAGLAT
jgi:5'-3' exonuclease